ncbi:MAG: hypothetical protein OK457_04630 [Thaumarchaeota archaeon]|nr:hypothetical protein [Nitrososphaerota archaeon]
MDLLLASASNAEKQNKLALRRVILELIQKRMGWGNALYENLDAGIKIIRKLVTPEARVRTPHLKLRDPHTNKQELTKAYRAVSLTIDQMTAKQMFHLIIKLKHPDLPLEEILKEVPASRYVLDSEGPISIAGNTIDERHGPTYSLDEEF